MTIQAVGSRLYVAGNTFPIKDQLKSIGCHWDNDRKQWWIGKAKKSELEKIVSGSSQSSSGDYVPPTADELAAKPCSGKVEYKGKTYYVVGQSKTGKLLLTVIDCSLSFWADSSDCRWVKRYEARERTYNYGRSRETVHQTVGSIRRFIEKSKQNDADKKSGNAETKQCWECGCSFTYHDARSNGGDWQDSYCGC
jgi:hypothetical protein